MVDVTLMFLFITFMTGLGCFLHIKFAGKRGSFLNLLTVSILCATMAITGLSIIGKLKYYLT